MFSNADPEPVALENLPLHHRDPSDHLTVAQTISEGCTLVNADKHLDTHGFTRL